jgi:AcrR family transcriptional regulator
MWYHLAVSVSDVTPLRADAQRNLERILTAAREAFAEYGLDAGVESIARRAGVGKATFFRRFPTKDALILAVLEGFVADMEAAAEEAVAMDDPWEGLRFFLLHNARQQADNHAFFDAMAARFGNSTAFPLEIPQRFDAAMKRVLEPAKRAGLVREGVEGGDLGAMTKMLGPAIRPVPGVQLAEAQWRRYLELLLSGIRAGQEPLPGPPMDPCALAVEAQSSRA